MAVTHRWDLSPTRSRRIENIGVRNPDKVSNMATDNKNSAIRKQAMAGAKDVIRRIPAGKRIGCRVPNIGGAVLRGAVKCQDSAGRKQNCVNSNQGPVGHTRPLTYIGYRWRLHGHWHRRAHGGIAGRVTRLGRKAMASRRGRSRIPRDGIGRSRNLRTQRRTVEKELNSDHAHIIICRRGNCYRACHRNVGRGRDYADRRRHGIGGRRCATHRRIHVGLDFGLTESTVVHSHLVKTPGKILAPDTVAADAQRARGSEDRSSHRLAGHQRTVDVNAQGRAVMRGRQMRPGVERQGRGSSDAILAARRNNINVRTIGGRAGVKRINEHAGLLLHNGGVPVSRGGRGENPGRESHAGNKVEGRRMRNGREAGAVEDQSAAELTLCGSSHSAP